MEHKYILHLAITLVIFIFGMALTNTGVEIKSNKMYYAGVGVLGVSFIILILTLFKL